MNLPTGTVTFLFTDMEGSTWRWEKHPEAMRVALARHDAILHRCIEEAHGGVVFRTVGDAFCAAFASASDALRAALDAQRALEQHPWDAAIAPIRVRMALHTGAAALLEGEYAGPTLNRVARLLTLAHGGQTLACGTTRDVVRDALPDGAGLRDLGEHRLKDLSRPERVYQVQHPDLPGDFPPLRSFDQPPNNLPQAVTSFVGRRKELSEVRTFLRGRTRLLTLTGPGGAGKTRLALQAAADLLGGAGGEGVWLVDLDAVTDPALVPRAVADALGVREAPGQNAQGALLDYLRDRKLLVLLDGCEHLLEACAHLADVLLRACPGLRVLATSREALGIAGERTYPVPPLSLPGPGESPTTAVAVSRYDAVRLFAERARLRQPAFAMTDANAVMVAQVCRDLDGIPLAIELAAARVRALPVEQIAARLGDDRFRLLTGGSRAALPRQQTLKALIDWSYDLLTEPEKALLARLSVFQGGWTLEAAEQVCADADLLPEWDVLDRLTELVEKSLVVYEDDAGQARYRMLETVRQYARDRLCESGETPAFRRHHAEFFLSAAEEARPHLEGAKQERWHRHLAADYANFRAALGWWLGPEGEPAGGLRLAGALWQFWAQRGMGREGLRWLDEALARCPGSSWARAWALNGAGTLAVNVWEPDAARAYLSEGLTVAREVGDARLVAVTLSSQGYLNFWLLDYATAAGLYAEAAELCRRIGDRNDLAWPLLGLGNVSLALGDRATGRRHLEECARVCREQDLSHCLIWALLGLAGATEQGRHAVSLPRGLFEEALAVARRTDNRAEVSVLEQFGRSARRCEDWPTAVTVYARLLALYRETGEVGGGAGEALGALAAAAAARGEAERAALLWGAAARWSDGIPSPDRDPGGEELARAEPLLAAARERLGGEPFAALCRRGRDMSLAEAGGCAAALPSRGAPASD